MDRPIDNPGCHIYIYIYIHVYMVLIYVYRCYAVDGNKMIHIYMTSSGMYIYVFCMSREIGLIFIV